MDTKFKHGLPFNEGMDTVKLGLSEDPQESYGTVNGKLLETSDILTAMTIHH